MEYIRVEKFVSANCDGGEDCRVKVVAGGITVVNFGPESDYQELYRQLRNLVARLTSGDNSDKAKGDRGVFEVWLA